MKNDQNVLLEKLKNEALSKKTKKKHVYFSFKSFISQHNFRRGCKFIVRMYFEYNNN